jgi:hypothetical protein
MDEKLVEILKRLKRKCISRAGMTSILLSQDEAKGICYMAMRKMVIKELERLK